MEFDDYETLPSSNVRHHMAAGALAGIFEHIVMYPIDSVKTRMQSLAPSPEASYRSVREGLFQMIQKEGIMRPVKGVNAVILGAGPAHALYFSAYEGIKKNFESRNTLYNDFVVNAGAGVGATLVHDAIMVPADVVKQRLQVYNSPYTSCLQCAKHLYKTDGLRAFYRSYTTQLAMNVPNHAILIIMYEKMQKILNPTKEHNPAVHCVAGATAGAVGAAVTTPLDVCKTLLNTQETSTLSQVQQSRISGIRNAIRTIYKMQGMSGFFRGIGARVMYQMPSTAIAWTVYEVFKHALKNVDGDGSCNPDQGNELVLDGVLNSTSTSGETGGWAKSSSNSGYVQEKKYSIEQGTKRLLQVTSPLGNSCSAQTPDENLLVK